MLALNRSFETISQIIDTPRKAYLEFLRSMVTDKCASRIDLAGMYQEQHSDTFIADSEFHSVSVIVDDYSFTKKLALKATSVSEMRAVKEQFDANEMRHLKHLETLRFTLALNGHIK